MSRPTAPWLTDEVINGALEYYGYSAPRFGLKDQIVLVNSQALASDVRRYERWLEDDPASRGTFLFNERHAYGASSLHALRSVMRASHFADQRVVALVAMPIHRHSHWSLLVLDRKAQRWRFYDSIRGAHDKAAYLIRAMLRDAGLFAADWTMKRSSCARQRSTWECGYSVLACAMHEVGARIGLIDQLNRAIENRLFVGALASDVLARSMAAQKVQDYIESRLLNYMFFQ